MLEFLALIGLSVFDAALFSSETIRDANSPSSRFLRWVAILLLIALLIALGILVAQYL